MIKIEPISSSTAMDNKSVLNANGILSLKKVTKPTAKAMSVATGIALYALRENLKKSFD